MRRRRPHLSFASKEHNINTSFDAPSDTSSEDEDDQDTTGKSRASYVFNKYPKDTSTCSYVGLACSCIGMMTLCTVLLVVQLTSLHNYWYTVTYYLRSSVSATPATTATTATAATTATT